MHKAPAPPSTWPNLTCMPTAPVQRHLYDAEEWCIATKNLLPPRRVIGGNTKSVMTAQVRASPHLPPLQQSTMAPAPVRRGPAPPQRLPKQRYFKGKPGAEVRSDSDSDEEEEAILPTRQTAPKLDPNLVAGGAGKVLKMESTIKVDLSKAKIGDGGVKHGKL